MVYLAGIILRYTQVGYIYTHSTRTPVNVAIADHIRPYKVNLLFLSQPAHTSNPPYVLSIFRFRLDEIIKP